MKNLDFLRVLTLGLLCMCGPLSLRAEDQLVPKRIVAMQYPRLAHFSGQQGKTDLVATISPDGAVVAVRAVPRPNVFSDAAIAALSKWLFSGCSSTAEKCEIKITFTFILEGDPCIIDTCPTNFQVDLPSEVEVRARPAAAIRD